MKLICDSLCSKIKCIYVVFSTVWKPKRSASSGFSTVEAVGFYPCLFLQFLCIGNYEIYIGDWWWWKRVLRTAREWWCLFAATLSFICMQHVHFVVFIYHNLASFSGSLTRLRLTENLGARGARPAIMFQHCRLFWIFSRLFQEQILPRAIRNGTTIARHFLKHPWTSKTCSIPL